MNKSIESNNPKTIKAWWWVGVHNLGDIMTPWVVKNMFGVDLIHTGMEHDEKDGILMGIGSIAQGASENSIVWGSGFMSSYSHVKPNVEWLAVRGPLSRQKIIDFGEYCPEVYGDPALLTPLFFQPKIEKTYKVGIFPHYCDWVEVTEKYKDDDRVLVIKPRCEDGNVETPIEDIMRCERIVSSSLHGIILAHAYRIPAVWAQFNGVLAGEPGFKFRDYFASVSIAMEYTDLRTFPSHDDLLTLDYVLPEKEFDCGPLIDAFNNKFFPKVNKSLWFGQQKENTIGYFGEDYANVPIEDFPHYSYLKGDKQPFIDYLKHSWGTDDLTKFNTHFSKFEKLKDTIQSDGEIFSPAILCQRLHKDGYCVIDGNHRLSIAKLLNIECPTIEISLLDHLKRQMGRSAYKFAMDSSGKPYQSIISKGKIFLRGRRCEDIIFRNNQIRAEDIVNKDVLDIGCNIGTSSIFAKEMGANSVTGIEAFSELVIAAIRIATLAGTSVNYKMADFSVPTEVGKFDTVFSFSVHAHINPKELGANIDRTDAKVLYFESHKREDVPLEISKYFKEKVELEPIDSPNGIRRFFRLER